MAHQLVQFTVIPDEVIPVNDNDAGGVPLGVGGVKVSWELEVGSVVKLFLAVLLKVVELAVCWVSNLVALGAPDVQLLLIPQAYCKG